MNNFKDKVIWITGASSGFGEALAYELANLGAKIILSARRLDELERVKHKIPSASVLLLDLEQSASFPNIVTQAINIHGHIDIMIHNGGIGQRSSVLNTSIEQHRRILEVDYFSYIELTKLLLPHFLERQQGHFVATSGFMGKVAMPLRSAYCAAKFALHGFFDSLRVELKDKNIFVTLLVPGAMKTNLAQKAQNNDSLNKELDIPTSQPGCPVNIAAKQAVEAINNKVFESYIGNKDKAYILLLLNKISPGFVKKIIMKQS